MGINLGAFLAPLVCGYLGQHINWHLGFAAAGFGMAIGVIQYVLGGRHLGDAGLDPVPAASPQAAAALRSKVTAWGGVVRGPARRDRGRRLHRALPISAAAWPTPLVSCYCFRS